MSNQPDETDTRSTPTRPWWRKKRWVAVGLLWFGFVYLLSEGPAYYAEARGWIPLRPLMTVYRPAKLMIGQLPYLASIREGYRGWWNYLGNQHRVHETGMSGPGWKVALRYRGVEPEGIGLKSWDDEDGVVRHNSFVRFVGHKLVIENGHQLPDKSWKWDGPVLWDGEPVADLPTGTRQIVIDYIDGELTIEADGVEVDVRQ